MASEFDGLPIDVYQGRFSGAFEVEFSDEKHLQVDNEVMIVVRAKCGGATLKSMANGDIRLVRSLKLQEGAVVKNGKLKAYLADQLDMQRDEDPLQISPGPTTYKVIDLDDDDFGLVVPDDDEDEETVEVTPQADYTGGSPDEDTGGPEDYEPVFEEEDDWDEWDTLPAPTGGPRPGEIRRVGYVAPADPLVARYLAGSDGD